MRCAASASSASFWARPSPTRCCRRGCITRRSRRRPTRLTCRSRARTFPDLVFPIFLFTIGVAIPLAMTRRLEKGVGREAAARRALPRRALLFLALLRQHFDSASPVFESAILTVSLTRLAIGLAAFAVLFLVFTRFRTPGAGNAAVVARRWMGGGDGMFALVRVPIRFALQARPIDGISCSRPTRSCSHGHLAGDAGTAASTFCASCPPSCGFGLLETQGGLDQPIYEYDPVPWLYSFAFFSTSASRFRAHRRRRDPEMDRARRLIEPAPPSWTNAARRWWDGSPLPSSPSCWSDPGPVCTRNDGRGGGALRGWGC